MKSIDGRANPSPRTKSTQAGLLLVILVECVRSFARNPP